jgi:hypothetical protein
LKKRWRGNRNKEKAGAKTPAFWYRLIPVIIRKHRIERIPLTSVKAEILKLSILPIRKVKAAVFVKEYLVIASEIEFVNITVGRFFGTLGDIPNLFH